VQLSISISYCQNCATFWPSYTVRCSNTVKCFTAVWNLTRFQLEPTQFYTDLYWLYFYVPVDLPQIKTLCAIHCSKESRIYGWPLNIKDIVSTVFKWVETGWMLKGIANSIWTVYIRKQWQYPFTP
jgi:hypothetical protein